MQYLVVVSVVLLNLGLVLHPDFHPEAFLLAVASTKRVSIVSGVSFLVLEFPGLGVTNEEIITTKLNPFPTSHSSTMASKGVTALTVWSPIKQSRRATFILLCLLLSEIFVLEESQYN